MPARRSPGRLFRRAEDASDRAGRINTILATWRREAVGHLSSSAALVDLLAENPFWTVKGAATRLGVAYTTAQRAIEALVGQGVLSPASAARRDRVFVARAILDILEEPARLVAEEANGPRRRGVITRRERR